MKILVLGGDGMLGHQLLLSLHKNHDIKVTLRQTADAYSSWNIFHKNNSYFEIDIMNHPKLLRVLMDFQPNIVINAIGLVKQRDNAKEASPNLEINGLFPHHLANMCRQVNARMIHISTDCVFSGMKGSYLTTDFCDATDLYGKTKYLGELKEPHCITLRTSMIGLELSRKTSLIEWFLAQKGLIQGYKRAIYTGFTTQELSRIIERVLTSHVELSGVWQVASEPIDKYTLLMKLVKYLKRDDIQLQADENFVCDRSLNGTLFCQATGYQSPSWDTMLMELAQAISMRTSEKVTCNV